MEGLFEIAFEHILKGAIQIIEAYYGSIPYDVADKIVREEQQPTNEKEKALLATFRTLKHMFILNYNLELVEEDRYEKTEEVIEILQEEILKYILLLIDDIKSHESLATKNKIPEITEQIIHAINTYKKIGNIEKIQHKITEKLETIRNSTIKNIILKSLNI